MSSVSGGLDWWSPQEAQWKNLSGRPSKSVGQEAWDLQAQGPLEIYPVSPVLCTSRLRTTLRVLYPSGRTVRDQNPRTLLVVY